MGKHEFCYYCNSTEDLCTVTMEDGNTRKVCERCYHDERLPASRPPLDELTTDEFETLSTAATYLVHDGGKRGEMLRVFFNQVLNECNRANVDRLALLAMIRDELQARIDSPQTPDEYLTLFPDDED